jgi:hypothetical protein
MAQDVWGVVDGGGVIKVASRATRGRRAATVRFANVQRRLGGASVVAERRSINGERAIVVRLAVDPSLVIAVIHLVTKGRMIAGFLVDRDPRRLAALGTPLFRAASAR